LANSDHPIKTNAFDLFSYNPLENNVPSSALFDDVMPFVDAPLTQNLTRVKQTWAIGGGKGGVGKSLFASSLAISLSRLGYKVVAVDLDLGGANLHTTLGVHLPSRTLSDFVNQKVSHLNDCVVPTSIPNLGLISGAQDALGITEMGLHDKVTLLKAMREVDADYLIYDLGAGTASYTIDFFNFSEQGLMIILPEPTSIENGYRFIKSAYYRYLGSYSHLKSVRPLIEKAMGNAQGGIQSPSDLFREVNNLSPDLGLHLKKAIQSFSPQLVINQARTQSDIEIGNSIKIVCKKYFGFNLQFLGHVEYDTAVWQAIRKKRPLLLEFSNSRIASVMDEFVRRMIQPVP
jgi:flagellar biosynthesis protein FlhG